MSEKFLIVNADDFGLSSAINRGIVRAHRDGIVTSASLMVRWPAAREAAQMATAHPALSVGLHVDFGEWEQCGDDWRATYHVIDTGNARAVRREAAAQLQKFRELVGRDPTHIDSHQHVHQEGHARHVLWSMGRQLCVPVRHLDKRVRYCGSFYGLGRDGVQQNVRITPEALTSVFAELLEGTTELCTHPGEAGECGGYGEQRASELQTLCNPSLRAALRLMGINLISFAPPPPHPLALRSAPVATRWRDVWRRVWPLSRRSLCEQS